MVEGVEEFRAELALDAFGELELLVSRRLRKGISFGAAFDLAFSLAFVDLSQIWDTECEGVRTRLCRRRERGSSQGCAATSWSSRRPGGIETIGNIPPSQRVDAGTPARRLQVPLQALNKTVTCDKSVVQRRHFCPIRWTRCNKTDQIQCCQNHALVRILPDAQQPHPPIVASGDKRVTGNQRRREGLEQHRKDF